MTGDFEISKNKEIIIVGNNIKERLEGLNKVTKRKIEICLNVDSKEHLKETLEIEKELGFEIYEISDDLIIVVERYKDDKSIKTVTIHVKTELTDQVKKDLSKDKDYYISLALAHKKRIC